MRYVINFDVTGQTVPAFNATSLRGAINHVRKTAKPYRAKWDQKPRRVAKQAGSILKATWDGGNASIVFEEFVKEVKPVTK
jgi:hypothetical protein